MSPRSCRASHQPLTRARSSHGPGTDDRHPRLGPAHLLPRCLSAIQAERVDAHVIVVDNASELPVDVPDSASRIALTERHRIGGARNAGLACVAMPYVVIADADDEIVPGSLAYSIALLHRRPRAAAVIGRSIVNEDGQHPDADDTPHAVPPRLTLRA